MKYFKLKNRFTSSLSSRTYHLLNKLEHCDLRKMDTSNEEFKDLCSLYLLKHMRNDFIDTSEWVIYENEYAWTLVPYDIYTKPRNVCINNNYSTDIVCNFNIYCTCDEIYHKHVQYGGAVDNIKYSGELVKNNNAIWSIRYPIIVNKEIKLYHVSIILCGDGTDKSIDFTCEHGGDFINDMGFIVVKDKYVEKLNELRGTMKIDFKKLKRDNKNYLKYDDMK